VVEDLRRHGGAPGSGGTVGTGRPISARRCRRRLSVDPHVVVLADPCKRRDQRESHAAGTPNLLTVVRRPPFGRSGAARRRIPVTLLYRGLWLQSLHLGRQPSGRPGAGRATTDPRTERLSRIGNVGGASEIRTLGARRDPKCLRPARRDLHGLGHPQACRRPAVGSSC
jgi:hypothetical protein